MARHATCPAIAASQRPRPLHRQHFPRSPPPQRRRRNAIGFFTLAGRAQSRGAVLVEVWSTEKAETVSPPTIYAWIHAEEARGKRWQRYLRRLGRKRPEWEKRGRLTSVSIEGRPAVVTAVAAMVTGKETRSWAPIAVAGPSRWSSGSRVTCCWPRS